MNDTPAHPTVSRPGRHRKSWRNLLARRTVHLIANGSVLMHHGRAVSA